MIDPTEQMFKDHWAAPVFQEVYLSGRTQLYRQIARIASGLHARTVLDIGCAFGQLVDYCNRQGMEAWGLDLPFPQLREQHEKLLDCSKRFLYGSLENEAVLDTVAHTNSWDLIICLDTARYFHDLDTLVRLRARHYLIKEVCDNAAIRTRRAAERDVHVYSPAQVAKAFDGYIVRRIYLPRFVLSLPRPSAAILALINRFSPTYTILLQRKDKDA